ncbi:MAG: hypothetical protein ACYTHM_24735, partial [Planctomycetota bacterium]
MASGADLWMVLLGLKKNFFTRDTVLASLEAWAETPDRLLADILEERGVLSREHRAALDALVA